MAEIPNNAILIDEFSRLFDGFSIGSNDLTQLTLGIDRDSALVAISLNPDSVMKTTLRLVQREALGERREAPGVLAH